MVERVAADGAQPLIWPWLIAFAVLMGVMAVVAELLEVHEPPEPRNGFSDVSLDREPIGFGFETEAPPPAQADPAAIER